jgi:hypothetical protein
VVKLYLSGALAGALLTASAATAAVHGEAPAWLVTPAYDVCRTEIDLVGASGGITPVSLVSDGETFQLMYPKADAPERAFLPIRIDHRPFANLVLRQANGRGAAMLLSPETVAALRKGGVLQIGWLVDEPVQARLTGSEQGLNDLKVCGAQVAARLRTQQAAAREAKLRADADARARAVTNEQLAAAKAQREVAEAEAQRTAAETERLQAQAAADRARALAEAEAVRQRAEDDARTDSYPYARAGAYPDPRAAGYYPDDPYRYYDPPTPYGRW